MLLVLVSAFGCADLIGLNALDDGDDSGSGGAGSDETGATGGSSSQTGGTSGDESGGTSGTNDGGTGGTDSGGGTSSGGGGPSGGDGGGPSDGGSQGAGGGTDLPDQPDECTGDEFQSETLTESCWQAFQSDLLTAGNTEGGYDLAGGLLTFTPVSGQGWTGSDAGFLMYQEIEGNFLLEVQAQLMDLEPIDNPPTVAEAFVGIVAVPWGQPLSADDPNTYADSYAIKFGTFDDQGGMGYRAQYTSDGVTTAAQTSYEMTWISLYLRICRVADVLWTGVKPADEEIVEWIPLHADGTTQGSTEPYATGEGDLPKLYGAVRVGMIGEVLSDGVGANARAVYGKTEFKRPVSLSQCWAMTQ